MGSVVLGQGRWERRGCQRGSWSSPGLRAGLPVGRGLEGGLIAPTRPLLQRDTHSLCPHLSQAQHQRPAPQHLGPHIICKCPSDFCLYFLPSTAPPAVLGTQQVVNKDLWNEQPGFIYSIITFMWLHSGCVDSSGLGSLLGHPTAPVPAVCPQTGAPTSPSPAVLAPCRRRASMQPMTACDTATFRGTPRIFPWKMRGACPEGNATSRASVLPLDTLSHLTISGLFFRLVF